MDLGVKVDLIAAGPVDLIVNQGPKSESKVFRIFGSWAGGLDRQPGVGTFGAFFPLTGNPVNGNNYRARPAVGGRDFWDIVPIDWKSGQ